MPQQPPPPPPPPPPIPLRAHSESLSRQGSSDVPAPRIKTTLVSCFNRMDDDAWASVLLPKLQQDDSMPPLTATCQALKLLCQRFQPRLNLSSLTASGDPNQVDTYTTTLAQRFPAVSSIGLAITRESSYRCVSAALPALARLSQLTKLSINVAGPRNTLAMALQLANLRTLPHLQSLSLVLGHSWEDATDVWQELGKTTQLKTLELSASPTLTGPVCRLQDIAALRDMSRLQRLHVHTSNLSLWPPSTQRQINKIQKRMQAKQSQVDAGQQAMQHQAMLLQRHGHYPPGNQRLYQLQRDHQHMQTELMGMNAELQRAQAQLARRQQLEASESMDFLEGLTALTSLCLPVPTNRSLSSITACSHLQELKLLKASERRVTVSTPVCGAMGTLTNLRTLHVGGDMVGTPMSPSFYNCLKDLTHLSKLSAHCWAHEALPVLCQLNHLCVIKGGWAGSARDYSAFICPSVTLLCCTWGDGVPFSSFPSLLCVGQSGSFDANSITALSSHCFGLTSLHVCPGAGHASLSPGVPAPQRVAALQTLARMPNLVALELNVFGDVELGAVASAGVRLQQLTLRPAAVSMMGLMLLGRMRNVQRVCLLTNHLPATQAAELDMLLLALHELPELSWTLPTAAAALEVSAAATRLQGLHLGHPRHLHVTNYAVAS